jgi:hypothetical protein
MHTTAFKIAVTRAKMVARHEFGRAVALMTSVGISLHDATRFLLSCLRMQRAAA